LLGALVPQPDQAAYGQVGEPDTAGPRRVRVDRGISLGTVKSTVSRAVAKLRIDAELGEDSGALLFGRTATSAALPLRLCYVGWNS